MTTVQYVELGHTVVGGTITDAKKVMVLLETYRDGTGQPMMVRQTLTGKRFKSFGVPLRVFSFTALIQATAATGYASKSDMEGFIGAATVANNAFKFRDPFGTIWDVVISKDAQLEPRLAPVMEGSDGWYSVDLELQQTA